MDLIVFFLFFCAYVLENFQIIEWEEQMLVTCSHLLSIYIYWLLINNN